MIRAIAHLFVLIATTLSDCTANAVCEFQGNKKSPKILICFFIIAVLALTANPSTRVLSCEDVPALTYLGAYRYDGFGAQVQNMVACFLKAKTLGGHIYAHKPFSTMHFVPLSDVRYLEDFLHLGEGEVQMADLPENSTTIVLDSCQGYGDSNPHLWSLIRPLLREKLFLDKRPRPLFESSIVRVAIHIRRGFDATQESARFTNISEFVRVAQQVADGLQQLDMIPHIAVHSTGHPSDFDAFYDAFGAHTVKLHLGNTIKSEDVDNVSEGAAAGMSEATRLFTETWLDLVNADILISSKSSFSYSAALYSKGIVLCPPFWHQKLPEWLCMYSENLAKNIVSLIKSKYVTSKAASIRAVSTPVLKQS